MVKMILITIAVGWCLSAGLVRYTPEINLNADSSGIRGVAAQLAEIR